jgi:hypothetical protein
MVLNGKLLEPFFIPDSQIPKMGTALAVPARSLAPFGGAPRRLPPSGTLREGDANRQLSLLFPSCHKDSISSSDNSERVRFCFFALDSI